MNAHGTNPINPRPSIRRITFYIIVQCEGAFIISTVNIIWFRQDLRLHDNPALVAALQTGCILPVYILDDENAEQWAMGGASRVFLHESLHRLNESLEQKLLVLKGDASKLLPKLIRETQAARIYWNRCYEPWRIARDKKIKSELKEAGIEVETFNGSLLWEPWSVCKQDGSPYQVFTPYYRKGCLQAEPPRLPLAKPDLILASTSSHKQFQGADAIDALELLPSINWHSEIRSTWKMGEAAASERLDEFLQQGLEDYKEGRNFPARQNVSRLSPHLHFGEISPNTVWHRAKTMLSEASVESDLDCFLSEIAWREFSYYLLYHKPQLPHEPIQAKFQYFPWEQSPALLKAWQQGKTGYPLVDAGMRELWRTGYMHNRVRMVVGSFLVKNLLIHWREGEQWFWDCLIDADLASNSASWQWIAGCGADAAPYFRVFNPVTQSKKFDADGEYIKRFVPELKQLPAKYLHAPSEAPAHILQEAGIVLGKDYPMPIVDLKPSRERALAAFKSLSADSLLQG
ncbi:MAG: deoxyribodipyrimidine photo-lyase [Pseudohongiellaceae bacterium]|nr:deoxyribodipyrimidine photo-lyase [Pseudohongiellaceae bacterium]